MTLQKRFESDSKAVIGLFYVLTVVAWAAGGWMLGVSWPYAVGMSIIAGHLIWQTWRFNVNRPEISYRLFLANILTGALLAVAALAGTT